MDLVNLLTVYNSIKACSQIGLSPNQQYDLKSREPETLAAFMAIMKEQGVSFDDVEGVAMSYKIPQMGQEFDLLRVGSSSVLNIELKSQMPPKGILRQMVKHAHYLSALKKQIQVYTFVAPDQFYVFDPVSKKAKPVPSSQIANAIQNQKGPWQSVSSMNTMFHPRQFLVSPFNNTSRFLKDEYFLTTQQEDIKNEILNRLDKKEIFIASVAANAGTGKTLLLYDLAKTLLSKNGNILIVHGSSLNKGHKALSKSSSQWKIVGIQELEEEQNISALLKNTGFLFLDETQRLPKKIFQTILKAAQKAIIPVILVYDRNPYLYEPNSGKDVAAVIDGMNLDFLHFKYRLTNKIRTNKEMAAFIQKCLCLKKQSPFSSYGNIQVELVMKTDDLSSILNAKAKYGWRVISTAVKSYYPEDEKGSHSSITGQEFSKVLCLLDEDLFYNPKNGYLESKVRDTSVSGLLYEILSRAQEQLLLVVYNNPLLYFQIRALIKGQTVPGMEHFYHG